MPKRKRSTINDEEAATTTNQQFSSLLASDPNAVQARENDVLFGRGDSINRHPGNKKFRELVDSHKRVYLASRFKQEKRMIADSIMSAVHSLDPPGRFLAKDSTTGLWQVVGEARAREKTLQALREKARSIRTQLEESRDAPRPSLTSETLGGRYPQNMESNLPHAAAFLSSSGLTAAQPAPPAEAGHARSRGFASGQPHPTLEALPLAGSTGISLAVQANPTFAALSCVRGLPPAQSRPTLEGFPRQEPQSGALPALLNPYYSSSLAIQPPSSTPAASNVVASALILRPNPGPANSATSTGGLGTLGLRRLSSRATTTAVPLAPPPSLPSTIRAGRGNTAVQPELSSRLMSNQETASLMARPPNRLAKDAALPVDTSLTPRAQPQNTAVAASPMSAGTFDALQRVAFPESPSLDLFFAGSNHPFSPRRLPPTRDARLSAASPTIPVNFLRQLDPADTLSPLPTGTQHLQLSTFRQSTPAAPSQLPLSASQARYAPRHQLMSGVQPQLAVHDSNYPIRQHPQPAYSPIQICPSTAAAAEEDPTPPVTSSPFHGNFLASPSMLHLLGNPGANSPVSRSTSTTSSSTNHPRGVPLPRASLAPRIRRETREEVFPNQQTQPPHDSG